MGIKIMLYEIAHDKKLRLTEISRMSGISRTTLTALNFETNKGIRFDTLNKLCEVLHCGPGDLIKYIPEETE